MILYLLYIKFYFLGSEDKPKPKKDMPKLKDKDGKNKKLDEDPACADDVSRFCHEVPKGNNFAILVCLQDKAKVQ